VRSDSLDSEVLNAPSMVRSDSLDSEGYMLALNEKLLEQFRDGSIPYPKINISNGIQTTIELYTDNKQLENIAFKIEKIGNATIGNATFKLDQYELNNLRDELLGEVEDHQLKARDKLCVDLYNDISIAETFITDSMITKSDFIILVKIGKKIIGLCCGNYASTKTYPTRSRQRITPLVYIELLCGTNSFSLVGTIIIRFLKQIVALTAKEKGSITINDSILLKSIDDPDTESFYANTSDFIKFDIENTSYAGYIWFLDADGLYFKSLTEDSIIPYAKPTDAERLKDKIRNREDYERRIQGVASMIRESDVPKQSISPPRGLVRADTISLMNVDNEIEKILNAKFKKLLTKMEFNRLKGGRRRTRKPRKVRKPRKTRKSHLLQP
jgi:hypothetical protein